MGDDGKCAKTFSLPKPSRIQMEEEEARGDLHTARKRRVATLRRADPEDYEKYWGKYDYISSGWASRAAQIRTVCSA